MYTYRRHIHMYEFFKALLSTQDELRLKNDLIKFAQTEYKNDWQWALAEYEKTGTLPAKGGVI